MRIRCCQCPQHHACPGLPAAVSNDSVGTIEATHYTQESQRIHADFQIVLQTRLSQTGDHHKKCCRKHSEMFPHNGQCQYDPDHEGHQRGQVEYRYLISEQGPE